MKIKKEKYSRMLLVFLVLSMVLPGCRSGGLLKNTTTTSSQSINEIMEQVMSEQVAEEEREIAEYADKTIDETGLAGTWDSLEFAHLGKKCDWIGKTLSEVEADTDLDLYVPNEATTLPPGTQQDVGLSTETFVRSGGKYERFIITLTVENADRKQTIPLADATVVAVGLTANANASSLPPEVASAWVLPQGVALGGSSDHARELYGEPAHEWSKLGETGFVYLKDGKSLAIWANTLKASKYKGAEVRAALLRSRAEPDFITKNQDNTEFATDLSGEPYLNVAGYKVYLETPLRDAIENLYLVQDTSLTQKKSIPAHSATSYLCNIVGYGNSFAAFRVANLTDAEIPIEDGTIFGIEVHQYKPFFDPVESQVYVMPKPEYLERGDPARGLPYTLPVYGPYGIAAGDSQEDLLMKCQGCHHRRHR